MNNTTLCALTGFLWLLELQWCRQCFRYGQRGQNPKVLYSPPFFLYKMYDSISACTGFQCGKASERRQNVRATDNHIRWYTI